MLSFREQIKKLIKSRFGLGQIRWQLTPEKLNISLFVLGTNKLDNLNVFFNANEPNGISDPKSNLNPRKNSFQPRR